MEITKNIASLNRAAIKRRMLPIYVKARIMSKGYSESDVFTMLNTLKTIKKDDFKKALDQEKMSDDLARRIFTVIDAEFCINYLNGMINAEIEHDKNP